MPRFLLITVGCIECGDPTVVEQIVTADAAPDGYEAVTIGAEIKLSYKEPSIAVVLPEEAP